jgi:hypothetical protein
MKVPQFISLILLGYAALCLVSCVAPPPGEGWKARTGFSHAVPIITALEKFHREQGHYPKKLEELVPVYLSSEQLLLPRPLGGGIERIGPDASYNPNIYAYDEDGNSYTLNFSYEGPGINRCFYDSKDGKWYCSGHY